MCLSGGRIVKSGDKSLAQELERRGYDWVLGAASRMNAARPTRPPLLHALLRGAMARARAGCIAAGARTGDAALS